jgi:diacylglycerol kinase (ATP)
LRFVNQGRKDFRIIICGGDGTIPWVLGELLKVGIDLTSIVLGIIPIGTGNDFSRSLGWGTDPVKVSVKNFEQLGQLVKKWMNATIGFYDMWDVEVQTFENGMIYDIKDQKEIERT